MKFSQSGFVYFVRSRTSSRNRQLLRRFAVVFVATVLVYSALFQALMAWEGREYGWVSGIYWTLTVMSTLGLGDIAFTSDLGRVFSTLVLVSGLLFLLILFPFIIIQFFQSEARVPRELPKETRSHVVLTNYNPITVALVKKLMQYRHPYTLIIPDLQTALRLHDDGLKVVVGELDNPETYERVHIEQAALIATTGRDASNANVTYTVREVSETVPIIATAKDAVSAEILQLAGCSHALDLSEMMGQSLARRTIWGDAVTHEIGEFGELLVAEATAAGTPLVGKTIMESRLREEVGITAAGVWERGRFETARPDTLITSSTVLVLAGSRDQLQRYDEFFCIYHFSGAPVVILGGGRVGRATGRGLERREIDYRIVERRPELVQGRDKLILGDAADTATLIKAGIEEAPAVIVTTHDDDTNIYLTISCRRLRPEIQIISRATLERNVPTLHRAGADFVMSYASMGANTIFNLLKRSDVLMIAEGLDVFKVCVPVSLAGQTITETPIRSLTGCSVIGLNSNGQMHINPDPHQPLPKDGEIILIGTVEAENRFLEQYGTPAKI
jgi:Trk K+ transport system NAD-binding subunit